MSFLEEYTRLDRFDGAEAAVFIVRHNKYNYIRAVRVLNATITDTGSDAYKKFLGECETLLKLGNGAHHNIVRIYRYGLEDGKAYIEMDYVDGKNIDDYLKYNHNFISVDEVIRMATEISSALAYCHEDIYRFCYDRKEDNIPVDPNDGSKVLIDDVKREELINKYKVRHNDIHSGNIMRREQDGNYILLDFGFAINGDKCERKSLKSKGAPEFKAPEKWELDPSLSEQSDIYSFGIVLYQCLAGRVPFPYNQNLPEHEAEGELAIAHRQGELPDIEKLRKEFYESTHKGQTYEKDYPQWLEDVIRKCLEKRPENRFKNGKELYETIIKNIKDTNYYQAEFERLNNKIDEINNELSREKKVGRSLQSQLNETQANLKSSNSQLKDVKSELSQKKRRTRLLIILLMLVTLAGAAISWHFYDQMRTQTENNGETTVPGNDTNTNAEADAKLIKELKDKIAQLENQIISKDQEIEKLKNEQTPGDESDEISRLNETIAKQTEQIQFLQAQLTNKQSEISLLNKELKNAKDASSANSASNSAEVSRLQTKIEQRDEEISILKGDLKIANNKINKLSRDIDAANNEVSKLSRDLEAANKEIKVLQKELEKK